ncbi:hypothetical protein LCGC14_2143400 [marine sediment metagenome]|uniref:Uncharacterized protein n=1 Tax=marine sediment metagenome TaxID=412755 RepID=A0A0F9DY11_9ZZZZ
MSEEYNEQSIKNERYTVKYIKRTDADDHVGSFNRENLIKFLKNKQNMVYSIKIEILK